MNEYYRTKDGIIGKYIMHLKGDGITDYGWRVFDIDILWYEGEWTDRIPEDYWEDFCDNDVVKASKNLIDLIEEGDYVNGKKAYSIGTICSTIGMLRTINFTDGTFITDDMQIVDVVTKEQFESVSYKVKE